MILLTYGIGSSKLWVLLLDFFLMDCLFFYLISLFMLSESSLAKSLKFNDISVVALKLNKNNV